MGSIPRRFASVQVFLPLGLPITPQFRRRRERWRRAESRRVSRFDPETRGEPVASVVDLGLRTRRSPFESTTLDGLFDRISRADRDPAPSYLSPTETKLLDGLLEKDPDARLTVGDLLEDPYLSAYALHEERQTQFRNRTPREKLSKRGSLRGGFAGNSPLVRGDGKEESPQLEKAPSETISELATLQSENATPPP